MKKNHDSSDVDDYYDEPVRCATTQSVNYQTLTQVRLIKTLSKNRIGKIFETTQIRFGAEQ